MSPYNDCFRHLEYFKAGKMGMLEKAGPHGLIRRGTVAESAEKVNAGSSRKVSEHTVHRNLLHIGPHSH